MSNRIGIRLEDKNEWERRVPITPDDVAKLTVQGIQIDVEKFERRTFKDSEYEAAKANLVDDASHCEFVLGVKEIPTKYFRQDGAYMFFSHTIKGQSYNMKMLRDLVDKKCTLIDYELVADEKGRRLIFFGRYAGLAGMIDTLWTLGQRLKVLGHSSPFEAVEPTHHYADLDAAKEAIAKIAKVFEKDGVPAEAAPLVIGFAGYGNVSKGAQEIFDLFPYVEVAPDNLEAFLKDNQDLRHKLIKVVYKEEDLVKPVDPSKPFVLQEYYDFPERYESIFEPHLGLLSVLVNCIFWNEKYPKLADADQLRQLFQGAAKRLLVVGDITCDVDGSLACTVRDTEPGDPVYVYNPENREAPSGFEGPGISVMAVGNLPSELPKEASETFSQALTPFIPDLACADFKGALDTVNLPEPIKRAIILWRGEFAPKYEYMQDFLR